MPPSPSFLCLFAEHIVYIKEEVPAWWFYQLTEHEKQWGDTDIPGAGSLWHKELVPLFPLTFYSVPALSSLSPLFFIRNNAIVVNYSGNIV